MPVIKRPVRRADNQRQGEPHRPGIKGGEEGLLRVAVDPAGGPAENDEVVVQVLRQLLALEVLEEEEKGGGRKGGLGRGDDGVRMRVRERER